MLVSDGERVVGTLASVLEGAPGNQDTCNYSLIDFEYRWGLSQISEALLFFHQVCHTLHRNVCPNTIYVTASGAWKLAGLGHSGKMGEGDTEVSCASWTSKVPKVIQPNLNFIAPETQHKSSSTTASDMYSLGIVIITCFNNGKSVIQANNSQHQYFKLSGQLSEHVNTVLPAVDLGLQQSVRQPANQDTRHRSAAASLVQIAYFCDPAVQALQFLESQACKDNNQKAQFFRNSLPYVLPIIPRKLWFQHVWSFLQSELGKQEMLAAVLESVIYMIQDSSLLEYQTYIQPHTRPLFTGPKTVQASVTLLDSLPIFLEKTNKEELEEEHHPHAVSGHGELHVSGTDGSGIGGSSYPGLPV